MPWLFNTWTFTATVKMLQEMQCVCHQVSRAWLSVLFFSNNLPHIWTYSVLPGHSGSGHSQLVSENPKGQYRFMKSPDIKETVLQISLLCCVFWFLQRVFLHLLQQLRLLSECTSFTFTPGDWPVPPVSVVNSPSTHTRTHTHTHTGLFQGIWVMISVDQDTVVNRLSFWL